MPGPRTAGCNVMPSPLQSCAPPCGGSVANLSRHPFHTNPASQRRAKFVVSQNADSRAQPDIRHLEQRFRFAPQPVTTSSIDLGADKEQAKIGTPDDRQ